MEPLKLPEEADREERQQIRADRQDLRKRLVTPDRDSRPLLLSKPIRTLLIRRGATGAKAAHRAKSAVEGLLASAVALAWVLLAGLLVTDAIRGLVLRKEIAMGKETKASVLYGHEFWGYAVLALSIAMLVTIIVDLYTYRPRLFSLCAGSPTKFFANLAEFSAGVAEQLVSITDAKPNTWKQAKLFEQGLLEESTQTLVLESVRLRITRRVVARLGALIASLALIGYAISVVSNNLLLDKTAAGAAMGEHLYFAMATFFTMGFGDVFPQHNALGYAYLALIAATFAAVVYFVLTEVISSQGEFRSNMRSAAETYVLQNSTL